MSGKVRVQHTYVSADLGKRWLVTCGICGTDDLIWSFFSSKSRKGYAESWSHAYGYAYRHAMAHEEKRCPTCLHIPDDVIDDVKEPVA